MFKKSHRLIWKNQRQKNNLDLNETKMWYIYIMEYYLAMNKNEVLIHAPTWMNLNHHAKWKKSVTKDTILYDPIYMKCPEGANLYVEKVD